MTKVNPLRDKYLAHIEKQKTSGLSIKKYCELNNLVEHKLSYYRSYKLGSKVKSPKSSFAKVQIKPKPLHPNKNKIDPVWLAEFINKLLISK